MMCMNMMDDDGTSEAFGLEGWTVEKTCLEYALVHRAGDTASMERMCKLLELYFCCIFGTTSISMFSCRKGVGMRCLTLCKFFEMIE